MQLYRQQGQEADKVEALKVSDRSHARSLLSMLGRSDRTADPRYAKLAEPPDLQNLQSQLLDNNTVLLEYSLGDKQSHLWVVSKNKVDYYPLKQRSEIENAAKEYYRYLTEPALRVRPNTTAQKGLALSQLILPQAVVKQLKQPRLLIVADGWLQFIPFNTLPLPQAGLSVTTPNLATLATSLITQYEITNLPSASTLALIRQAQRPIPTKTLAVFANPVFSRSDRRLSQINQTPPNTKQLAATSNGASFVEALYPPLPGTYNQAQAILKWVPDAAQRLEKYGFDASLQTITGTETQPALNLEPYKILHFATHGILDTQLPERSGMILSVIDRQGELQGSLLSPSDVLNLNLSAELVVLSGCRTGLGASVTSNNQSKQEVKAEGLVGLTGSFMVAGAQRVIASLWSVDDEATTELMKLFYRNVFEKKLSYAAALREAQKEMQANPRWREPYYWAGFIIQGEWR
jgi:CHAT domain-containing protein